MPTQIITDCPVCGSSDKNLFLSCKDHFVSGETFTISRCNACGFCFTDPRPSPEESARYYESDKYVSHSRTSEGLTNYLFHRARRYTLGSKKRLIRKYASGSNMLDYGCGTGAFLSVMKAAGWNTRGIEPNPIARNHAAEQYGLEVYDETALESIPDNTLDAITLWHVLEHIYPMKDRIHTFHKKLKKDGTLIVAVPNMNAYDAKHYGPYWAAYDVPRHIYHFTPESMVRLFTDSGFSYRRSKGMWLDAFYISLLSEKYKRGSDQFIRGMFFGLLSNFSSFLGKRNYSSIIYIFKKPN
jgi:2-polyprenyl-3-methyl-5-hydroxy-6-metoxy-1,4-benzoquinol methylase